MAPSSPILCSSGTNTGLVCPLTTPSLNATINLEGHQAVDKNLALGLRAPSEPFSVQVVSQPHQAMVTTWGLLPSFRGCGTVDRLVRFMDLWHLREKEQWKRCQLAGIARAPFPTPHNSTAQAETFSFSSHGLCHFPSVKIRNTSQPLQENIRTTPGTGAMVGPAEGKQPYLHGKLQNPSNSWGKAQGSFVCDPSRLTHSSAFPGQRLSSVTLLCNRFLES